MPPYLNYADPVPRSFLAIHSQSHLAVDFALVFALFLLLRYGVSRALYFLYHKLDPNRGKVSYKDSVFECMQRPLEFLSVFTVGTAIAEAVARPLSATGTSTITSRSPFSAGTLSASMCSSTSLLLGFVHTTSLGVRPHLFCWGSSTPLLLGLVRCIPLCFYSYRTKCSHDILSVVEATSIRSFPAAKDTLRLKEWLNFKCSLILPPPAQLRTRKGRGVEWKRCDSCMLNEVMYCLSTLLPGGRSY